MAEQGKPVGRGLKVLLYGSLALNLLIAGLVAGAFLSGGPGKDKRSFRSDMRGFDLVRALPREDRAELRARFETKRSDHAASGDKRRPSRKSILAALRADPFDPEAFAELVAAQTRALAERGRLGQEALIEQVTEMTGDERRAYADRVEEAFSRRRARYGDRDRQPR